MNDLVLQSFEITMTSLELTDLINQFREEEGNDKKKEHRRFLQDVREQLEVVKSQEGGEHGLVQSSYRNSQNKELPCYIMNKFWIMLMLNKESMLVRYKTQLYVEKLEKALNDLRFRQGDKKHQLNCMALLQDMLPEDMRQEKVSYIKANVIVDKAVSNYFGFPKMIKKKEMNDAMLVVRENALDDYLKLFEVLQDNSEVKQVLYKKYKQPLLEEKVK